MAAATARARQAEVAASVVMYMTCSVSMILLNKLVLHTFNLNQPNTLLFLQNSGALLLVRAAKALHLVDYPDFSWQIVKQWAPLTLLFVSMLLTSMKSIRLMSVAAQTIIKNLALVLTALGDAYLYGKVLTPPMYVSFLLMITGSYVGVKGDRWVTPAGLFWTFLNIGVTVCYTLYMKQLQKRVGSIVGRYGPVFYNNLLSLPFFFLLGVPEFGAFAKGLAGSSWGARLCLCAMTLISSGMTFAVFWCMSTTTPTTFSVAGSLNRVPLTVLGIFVFAQYPDPIGYVGICIAICGGFLYTYANFTEARQRDARVKKDDAALEATSCAAVVVCDK